MHEALISLIGLIRSKDAPSDKELDALLRDLNKKARNSTRAISKRRLLSHYMQLARKSDPGLSALGVTEAEHDVILGLLRAKPRRTASGVATVSVLTMPWPCAGECIYCPNDIRMPKSYMRNEPACQRAERLYFDPYLQVAKRLFVLEDMGHSIDKVELIVLGGTFSDYPASYRTWFAAEMFRALNEARTARSESSVKERCAFYEDALIDSQDFKQACDDAQRLIDKGSKTYNESLADIYENGLWNATGNLIASFDKDLSGLQRQNENALCRNVGLVFETRPECIDEDHLMHLRSLGATKIQIGIQSLDEDVLCACGRPAGIDSVVSAMSHLRNAGFKSHIHFMANLPSSTPEKDKAVWDMLVCDRRFMPDEVKVYPCALVESSHLMRLYESREWSPYAESELMDVLLYGLKTAPPYMRISRMIRDICSQDIVAGNRHTNLRQMVEQEAEKTDMEIREMRFRELATFDFGADGLSLEDVEYETLDSCEHFLQYTTESGRLAAFCRLSLPHNGDAAMVRELHVYGSATCLGSDGKSAQHKGLGRSLIERACEIAKGDRRQAISVISAVGTRGYYRDLGFEDDGLYQTMGLSQ